MELPDQFVVFSSRSPKKYVKVDTDNWDVYTLTSLGEWQFFDNYGTTSVLSEYSDSTNEVFITNNKVTYKPCVVCEKLLPSALDNWNTLQPLKGGEIQLIFSYGSEKFDLSMSNTTVFKGIICDDCAANYVNRMERVDNGE
jgi:hypothetical protein